MDSATVDDKPVKLRSQAEWCRTLARHEYGERPKKMLLAIAAEFDRLAEHEAAELQHCLHSPAENWRI